MRILSSSKTAKYLTIILSDNSENGTIPYNPSCYAEQQKYALDVSNLQYLRSNTKARDPYSWNRLLEQTSKSTICLRSKNAIGALSSVLDISCLFLYYYFGLIKYRGQIPLALPSLTDLVMRIFQSLLGAPCGKGFELVSRVQVKTRVLKDGPFSPWKT